MKMCYRFASILLLAGIAAVAVVQAQTAHEPISQRLANEVITRWPDGHFEPPGGRWNWNYQLGTLLEGMDSVWSDTGNTRYLAYIKASVDHFVRPDGSIATYVPSAHELDSILLGRQLLLLYRVTLNPRYAKAATFLYNQLQQQPRNPLGGFWHKQIYPNQMWLDGLYMAEPFYAEYSAGFNHPQKFNDIALQFELIYEHTRDPKTGLLYHGWDQSKMQRWANKITGDSSQFWGRGMGWYMMALVDTIPSFPAGSPGRARLIAQLRWLAPAIARVQDPETGVWWEVLNKGGQKDNYLEASASCMFVYALARGVRLGYLPPHYLEVAKRGYAGILRQFIKTGPNGQITLTGTVKGAGLGGHPYRDGSYAYYVSQKTDPNDPKGIGAFLLASTEMERIAAGKPVMPDPNTVNPSLIKLELQGAETAGASGH